MQASELSLYRQKLEISSPAIGFDTTKKVLKTSHLTEYSSSMCRAISFGVQKSCLKHLSLVGAASVIRCSKIPQIFKLSAMKPKLFSLSTCVKGYCDPLNHVTQKIVWAKLKQTLCFLAGHALAWAFA